ncbi:hypothetical protein [Hymenobacter algoricola]|uniref:DNA-binding protein n=1 Tax=Hymenobacter algoricola TaxID=486267 RepID=A0ABP7N9L4_9BACT
MGQTLEFTLPDSLVALLSEEATKTATEAVAKVLALVPQPVTEYSVPAIADAVDMAPDTVRRYMNLPAEHPQRLHYLRGMDGNRKLDRITLAQLSDWQRRRGEVPVLKPVRRPARRRAAA